MSELLSLGAVQLAARIRSGEADPVQVMDAHLERIQRVNPLINAVVESRFEQARADAADAKEAMAGPGAAKRDLPPFHGVPYTCKEHLEITGMRRTGGLWRRRDEVSNRDATVVRRMREAGFILMGTTNVPEAMMWTESYNKIYGRTTNAYSTKHISGGSSGGEAAIIGAGGSPIGIGGDIGGSIRNPAFFNGIVGLKPTGARIPLTGAWPKADGVICRYRTLGPMARRVEDLRAVMPILAGPDGEDPHTDDVTWPTGREFRPDRVRIHIWESNGIARPTKAIRQTLAETESALRDMGFSVERWQPSDLRRSVEMWFNALEHAGGHRFVDTLADFGEPVNLLKQWMLLPVGRSEHIYPNLLLGSVESLASRFPKWGKKTADMRLSMREEIEGKLGQDGVMIFPTFHTTAPRHGWQALRTILGFVYCGFLNPMELPAVAAPTGFDKNGLPTGVQIAGSRGMDDLCLYVAQHVEQAFGGWQLRDVRTD